MSVGSKWEWKDDGLELPCSAMEWAMAEWLPRGESTLRELGNVLIEVTVSGQAGAAGISFGHYKDFLVPLKPQRTVRRLRLEIDLAAERRSFRVRRWTCNRGPERPPVTRGSIPISHG
jgi:hypothetical protein